MLPYGSPVYSTLMRPSLSRANTLPDRRKKISALNKVRIFTVER